MGDALDHLVARVEGGHPLTESEIDDVVGTSDLIGLGMLADTRRRLLHGDRVTFVRVAEWPVAGSEGQVPAGAGEVRIVGRPATRDQATDVTRRVVDTVAGLPVTGFALEELAQLCGDDPVSLGRCLSELKQAGLDMIARARVEVPRLDEWLQVAGATGLDVTTLAVGEFAKDDDARSIRLAAGLGPHVATIRSFDPLPAATGPRASTGYGDTRQVALARLLVDNIDSIQVDWAGYGPKLAQVALTFGADDVDTVSPVETTDQGWRRTPLEEINRNIRAAALVPVERNGRFETRDP